MPRYSKTLTPAALAGFLAALRGGALVVAAAASAGVAVPTLYWRRRRDAAFDAAWRAAAEASAGWVLERRGGGPVRLARSRRRLRFDGARRARFLGGLALSCHTREAAEDALVDRGTVYRHIRRDPGFARDNEAALERGFARLERLAAEERAADARHWRTRPAVPPPGVRPPADFDEQMRLLRYWRRRPPRRRATWRDRQDHAPSLEQSLARLERQLRHLPRREEGPLIPSS